MVPLERRSLVPALNAAVLFGLYLRLFTRAGHVSTQYRLALVAGAVVVVLAAVSAFGRPLLREFIRRSPFAGAGLRGSLVAAPWIALLATILLTGRWWNQRPWSLRLFAVYVLVNWSVSWCVARPGGMAGSSPDGAAAPEAGVERIARRLLLVTTAILAALGIDGLAFGVTSFGTTVSAALACCASVVAVVAVFGSPAARGNVVVLCFGAIFGLVSVEAGLRLMHFGQNLVEVDNLEYVRLFHHLTPPRTAFVNWPKPLDEFEPALVEINSTGIRGPEIAPGPVDVLLIGDSMIEARQLPWGQTLGPRLQKAFEARSAPVRVVSHGVRGWSPLLEWNWYLKAGRELEPRVVLLFFFWNDLWTVGDEVQTFRAVMRPDGRPDRFDVVVEPEWVWYKRVRAVRVAEDIVQRVGMQTLKRAFSFVRGGGRGRDVATSVAGQGGPGRDMASARRLARTMAGDSLLTPGDIGALLTKPMERLDPRLSRIARDMFWPMQRPLDLWTDEQRRAAGKTENELRLFAEDVAADGGRLVIVHVPNPYQISPSDCSVARYLDGLEDGVVLPPDSGLQAWLRGVGARHGIELLDPSDAMRAFHTAQGPADTPLYLRADCHWSARGHQFMADYLADWYLRTQAAAR